MTRFTSLGVVALSLMLVGAGCTVTTDSGAGVSADLIDGGWTPGATAQAGIPSDPVSGSINGESVDIASVVIEDWGDDYEWSFSNQAPAETCGFLSGDDAVNFRSVELMEGTFLKTADADVEFDDAHAYYVYQKPEGGPHSVNTAWTAKIVVTEVQDQVSQDDFGNDIGQAMGYVELAFEDGQTEIAGSFTADICQK